ncbi:MAG TPA: PaaI family thioesterase [Ramlibacter sp.]
MTDVEKIQSILAPLLPGLMGIEVREATPERVVAAMRVRPDLCTTGDSLHGGAFMAFADTLGAVGTFLNLPKGARTTTTDSSTKFTRGAPVGSTVIGTATAFHRGRTTQVWQTLITTEDGKLCAVVTQTQLVIPAAPAAA